MKLKPPTRTSDRSELFDELSQLVTEQVNPRTGRIDTASTRSILNMLNNEDQLVAPAVRKELPRIARAVDLIVAAMEKGGRLFYIGAGTSGRLGVVDASECPPTFGCEPELVQGVIAGGYGTLVKSREGVEDRKAAGIRDLRRRGFSSGDILCGLAASSRTPYVLGALEWAREIGAGTVFIHCDASNQRRKNADVVIHPVVGPEAIMGSTRMKSGTAQKMVLNMLTTASMIRLGKVYGNLMVDLQMNSRKLEERSKRVVMMVTGLDYTEADRLLTKAGGHVKTALVMHLGALTKRKAQQVLKKSDGHVRQALALSRIS